MDAATLDQAADDAAMVDHLRIEHQHMRAAIHAVMRTSPEPCELFAARMRMLQCQMQHHFRDEEESGLLEEASARCPDVGDQVQQIYRAHRTMQSQVNQLVRQLEYQAADRHWQTGLVRLMRELRQHEQVEHHLVRRAFGIQLD